MKIGKLAEEIPDILWSYRIADKEAAGETPFQRTFGAKVVVSSEIKMASMRLNHFEEEKSNKGLFLCIDFIDVVHDLTLPRFIS